MPLYSVKGFGGGGSPPSPGSTDLANVQPTKQSNPTMPSITAGSTTINDMLMASPALPIPMTHYGWICPIHHQYHFCAGRIEKVELNYSDLQQDIGDGRNRRARTECTNDLPTKASAARSAQPLSEF